MSQKNRVKEIFPNVFKIGKEIYTKNLVPGESVYGEKLVRIGNVEYRHWNPFRSKPSAAIKKGLKNFLLNENSKILYLGAASGTTVSHFSDIATKGIIWAIEISETPFRKLLKLSEKRKNIIPILADARKPKEYKSFVLLKPEIVYCDVSQPDEIEIFIRNCREYEAKIGMIAIKSRSIDVVKKPEDVYLQAKQKIEKEGGKVLELIKLDPYQKDHAIIVCKF